MLVVRAYPGLQIKQAVSVSQSRHPDVQGVHTNWVKSRYDPTGHDVQILF